MTAEPRAFVEAEKLAGGNVAKACNLLQVPRSAYYVWQEHVLSARAISDADLTAKIVAAHTLARVTPVGG
jgi:hypothetical protein